jgi:RIO-like serine/threonine protein kinase
MLYQVEFNPTIAKNVTRAFKKIYARGVWYGDMRAENILVQKDDSVVVIDFETNADCDVLKAEQEQVRMVETRAINSWSHTK